MAAVNASDNFTSRVGKWQRGSLARRRLFPYSCDRSITAGQSPIFFESGCVRFRFL